MDTEPSQTRTRPRFRYASMDERSFYEIAATASAPALANTPASASKQAARATPTGLLRLLCDTAYATFGLLTPKVSRFIHLNMFLRYTLCDFWTFYA